MEPTKEEDQLAQDVAELSMLFTDMCARRHELGQEEYGAFTFLENDVIRMMCEELADIANYARMQFIKILLMARETDLELNLPQIGVQSFKGTGEGWKK